MRCGFPDVVAEDRVGINPNHLLLLSFYLHLSVASLTLAKTFGSSNYHGYNDCHPKNRDRPRGLDDMKWSFYVEILLRTTMG